MNESPRPPRPAETMVVPFDVDCGTTLVPGHTLMVRGLADLGRSRDDLSSADSSRNVECQMVELRYEIVPGVTPAETPTEPHRPFTVDATYGADVPLPWSTGGTGPDGPGGPGWHEGYRGGPSTAGGLGPWPVPDGARHLTFWLHAADTFSCRGALHVDLSSRTARWEPLEDAVS